MRRRPATRRLRRALLVAVAAVAAATALMIELGDVFERAERSTVDTRFAVRGEQPVPAPMTIVGIDDATFSAVGERFPFGRDVFARVLNRVARDEPRVIVYDVQFTESQGESDADIAADNALITAVRRAGNVVLSSTEVDARGETNVFGGVEAQRYARATVGSGVLPEDPGGVLRRLPEAVAGLPTLAVATVRRLGRPVDSAALAGRGAWIDYLGPPGYLPFVSFGDVYRGGVAPGAFRGRIVIIGATAPSLQDVHPTSWPGSEMAGPEIQASAVATLLAGVPLTSGSGLAGALLALALAVVAPLASLRLRPLVALGLSVGVAACYVLAVQLAFNAGTILPVVAPLAGLAVGLVGSLLVHYMTATFEREQTRDLFARFVPDSVVAEVLEHADRDDPRLGGVRRSSTVMFSDLRGFTAFAETKPPEQVIEVLNRYLSEMSDAILDHGGTLVAYMGDGIMAVFGAPLEQPDHADRAVAAAREMLVTRLPRFNGWLEAQGLGPDSFRMGIGVNTGQVMSGNVGSARRVEYAAVGDTTNTAARLEDLTKEYEHQVLIAESTREALTGGAADLEFVSEIALRGRQARVRVWTLNGDRVGA